MRKFLSMTIMLGMMLSLQGCFGVAVVDTGYRGLEVRFGKVVSDSLTEGMYFYNPFTTSIIEMDTRTQKLEYDSETYTKDIQTAKMHVVVNYNLEQAKVGDMYKSVGRDWEEKLIPQTVEGTLKSVVGKWDAIDLISNRAKAQQEIQTSIAANLLSHNVVVTRVEISNIDYTKEFEEAVEAKVKAIQQAEQAHNKTVQVQEEANQRVITAKAEAQSMQIRAEALSRNKQLVAWEAVQKWDGHMPNYMLGGNTMPFINIAPQEQEKE